MPISFTKAFVANGKTFASLEEAQQAEIEALFLDQGDNIISADGIALLILANADKIIDVLTTTESSRPAARRVNGGTKKRKPKTEALAAAQNAALQDQDA